MIGLLLKLFIVYPLYIMLWIFKLSFGILFKIIFALLGLPSSRRASRKSSSDDWWGKFGLMLMAFRK